MLYLRRYLTRSKQDYYRLLQAVRDNGNWETWLFYMLESVNQTAQKTIAQIKAIKQWLWGYCVNKKSGAASNGNENARQR